VTGDWRELHNEELRKLYASPNIIRVIKLRMRRAEYVVRMVEIRNAYKILVGKPVREGQLGMPGCRWEDLGCKCVDWMHLAQVETSGELF
jgi:hypothetical protein